MRITGCTAVPIVRIQITIGRIESKGGKLLITEREGDLNFYFPETIPEKLARGEEIELLCVPNEGLMGVHEILGLSVIRNGSTMPVYFEGSYWSEVMNRFPPTPVAY